MWYHVIFSAMVEFIFSFDLSLFTYNHFFLSLTMDNFCEWAYENERGA